MQKTKGVFFVPSLVFFPLILFLISRGAQAGGCYMTTQAGKCVLWDVAKTITYNLDPGGLKGTTAGDVSAPGGGGCSIDEAKALEVTPSDLQSMATKGAQAWVDAVGGGNLKFSAGADLSEDVNYDNAENFLMGPFLGGETTAVKLADCYDNDPNTACSNPIVFDPHGELIDAIGGECLRFPVVGMTNIYPKEYPTFPPTTTELQHAEIIINGTCVDPMDLTDVPATVHLAPCPGYVCPKTDSSGKRIGLNLADLQNAVTHEMGHFLGLDHVLINKKEYLACIKEPPEASCDATALANIPTMVGLYVNNADLSTLHFDDVAMIKRLYSSAVKANTAGTCTIKGTVYQSTVRPPWVPPAGDAKSKHEQRGEEVVARLGNDPAQAAGMVGGAEAARTKNEGKQDDCDSSVAGCGAYSIQGLKPGTYYMGVHDFTGGNLLKFNIEPLHPPLSSALYNDNDPAIEPPTPAGVNVTVTCGANEVKENIDLYTN